VDVADLRPADVTDGRRRRRFPFAFLIYVVLAGLIAVTVLLGLHLRSVTNRDDARDAVIAAARQRALDYMSIDYRTAAHDLQRLVDTATGQQVTIDRAQLASFPAILQQTKSVSTGDVRAAGLISFHGKTAVVALAINESVSTPSQPGAITTQRRLILEMTHVHGRWLTSKETFVGQGVPG
jgi:Mce-associated membrane protein